MTVVQNRVPREMEKWDSPPERSPYLQPSNEVVFALALFYIALPCLIFLVFYVHPLLSLPLIMALGSLLYKLLFGENWIWSPGLYVPASVLSLSLLFIVGIPTGHSVYDWIKHWALINEIANRPWPVTVTLHGQNEYLRYYLAAYLVPAAVHKTVPKIPVVVPVTVWFFIGYLLIFRLIGVAYQKRTIFVATIGMVLTLMLAGGDAYARHVIGVLIGAPLPGWMGFHYHAWPTMVKAKLQFASVLTNLAWVPNQSIAVFIVSAMLLMDRSQGSLARTIMAYGLMSLWSPYGMIGLLPLILLRVALDWRSLPNTHTIAVLIAAISFALLVATYLSTELPQGGFCATCIFRHPNEIWFIALFLLIELSTFALLLRRRIFSDRYCFVALITLALIPLFHGETIDFVARSSMGPLFVLALRSAERILDTRLTRTHPVPVALALALSLPTSLSEIVFHIEKGAAYRTTQASKLPEAFWSSLSSRPDITVTEFFNICGWKYESQYFSAKKPRSLRSAR